MTGQSEIVPGPREARLPGVHEFTELHRPIDDGWPPLSPKYNVRFRHDPCWRVSVTSIQCAADSAKPTPEHPGHPFWVAIKNLMKVANLAFILGPMLISLRYAPTRAWPIVLQTILILAIMANPFKGLRERFYWWRFERADKSSRARTLSAPR